jgi:hypothetical protein
MKPKQAPPPPAPIHWPRADPALLAAFDPRTKICQMNCGAHRDDPRTEAERKLLCDDCWPVTPPPPDPLLVALKDLVKAVSDTNMLPAKQQWYRPELQRAQAAIKAAEKNAP